MAVATPAFTAPMDVFDLSLEELMNIPVSIATKSNIKLTNTPSSVSVYDQATLKTLGVRNLVDLFDVIPGFYAMYNPVEGNQSYLVTRGHSQKYAANVLVLVNGQRLNDDYTGGVTYLNRFMPLTFAERVEVIRGPGSALYGSNAFNGVINIITKPSSQLAIAAQSFNGREVVASKHIQHNELQISIGAQAFKDDGANIDVSYDRFNLQTTTKDSRSYIHLDTQLKYKDTSVQLLHYESERDDYYLFRRLRDDVTNLKLSQSLIGLKHTLLDFAGHNINLYAEYNRGTRESITALALQNSTTLPDADFLFGEDFLYESYRTGLDYRYRFNNTYSLGTGIEWFSSQVPEGFLRSNYDSNDQYLGSVKTLRDETERAIVDKERNMLGLYTQLEYKYDKVSGVIGLRYDDYNDTQDKISPRLSLVYEHDRHNIVKVMYSEAFRAPSLGDLYDKESGLTDGNENLNAPKIHSSELSYQFIKDTWQVTSIFFYNDIENLIGFADDDGTVRLQNVATSSTHGFEVVANMSWNNWKNEAVATHLIKINSDIGNSDLTPYEALSPKNYGHLQSQYKINQHHHVSAKVHWRDQVDVIESDSGLALVSGMYDYHIDNQQTIHVSIDNLLDENYEVGSAIPLNAENDPFYQAYPMRGRVWRLEYEIIY